MQIIPDFFFDFFKENLEKRVYKAARVLRKLRILGLLGDSGL